MFKLFAGLVEQVNQLRRVCRQMQHRISQPGHEDLIRV